MYTHYFLFKPQFEQQNAIYISFLSLTLQWVSGQPQLVDDVSRDVRLHQLSLLGVVLRCLQQMVKLFRVELLSLKGGTNVSTKRTIYCKCTFKIKLLKIYFQNLQEVTG